MKQGESKLRYVGSPYQTSLSEAGQVKYLYNMKNVINNNITNSNSSLNNQSNKNMIWYEEERWELSVGKKFYKVVMCHLFIFLN